MLNALIIDDEAPSREELRALLSTRPDIEVLDECANAIEGLAAIHRLRPDVVFLDIQMPRVSGLEMVSMIAPEAMPRIVFVTAYDEHALRAFEEHAADYLLKPIDPQRLARTLDWLHSDSPAQAGKIAAIASPLQQIPCLALNRILLLPLAEVEFVRSELSGVHVICAGREGVSQLTLKLIEARTALIRCHRQYLVNPECIAEIRLLDNGGAEIISKSGKTIPVSRRYLREIKDRLLIA